MCFFFPFICRDLAQFHAEFWMSHKIWEAQWLPSLEDSKEIDLAVYRFSKVWEHYIPLRHKKLIPKAMLDFCDNYRENLPNLWRELGSNHCTLAHGDIWINNMAFMKGADNITERLCLFDWQTCVKGNGLIDLASLIDTGRNGKHEMHLLKIYYNTLLQYGVRQYSWEKCKKDFQLAKKWSWMTHCPVLMNLLTVELFGQETFDYVTQRF
jgi:thiamine kinase-like enzyme